MGASPRKWPSRSDRLDVGITSMPSTNAASLESTAGTKTESKSRSLATDTMGSIPPV